MTNIEQLDLLESTFPEADRITLDPCTGRWLICNDIDDGEGYTNVDAYSHIPGTRQFRFMERIVI